MSWRPPHARDDRICYGSSGGGGSSTVTNQTILPEWVQQAAALNIGRAQDLSNQPYQPYTGPTVAPLNATELAAINAVQQQLGSTAPAFAAAQSEVANLPQSTQALLNPYLGQVESDTVSNIQRAAALQGQQIAQGAVQAGAFGGSRYGVQQAVLDSETQRNIGQAVNQIQSQGWNTASQLALQQAGATASLAGSGQQAALQGAQAALTAGQLEQQQQQAQYASALQQYQAAQNYPYQQLAIAQSALSGTPYGATVTAQQPYNQNLPLQLAGLGISAAPLAIKAYNWAFPGTTAAAGAAGLSTPGAAVGAVEPLTGMIAGGESATGLGAAGAGVAADTAATAATGADIAGGATAAGGAAKGGADLAEAAPALLAA